MRPTLLALLTGLAGLAFVPYPAGPAAASCAAPTVDVVGARHVRGHAVLERGVEVTVRGQYFHDGCDDTGGPSTTLGCTTEDEREVEEPMQDVEMRLGSTAVATEDADDESRVTWTFTVPADLEPGLVTLYAGGARYGWVRIR